MDKFLIEGGQPLTGPAEVSGSKNAALPIMAAVLASDGPLDSGPVPDLDDVHSLLGLLGRSVSTPNFPAENQLKLVVEPPDLTSPTMTWSAACEPVSVSGPLLPAGPRLVSLPGGCNIGHRPSTCT
ncbi:MAG: hypothetical protein Ct9H300mP1_38710 [Planctomycetaceae bacterium]|nr:MAG: hypothetical protein Ct9H300mP1_38710 [Planctomycetaceae bacterium]